MTGVGLRERIRDSRINILHLFPFLPKRFHTDYFFLFEHLVTGLDKQTFSQLICCIGGDKASSARLDDFGHSSICLGMSKKHLKAFRPSLAFRIARLLRVYNIDIIHCQRHKATVYGTFAAWLAGSNVRVVTTVHGQNVTRGLSRKAVNALLFNRISRIIAVSNAVRTDILQTNWISAPRKVVTVYNGIDANRFDVLSLPKEEACRRLHLDSEEAFVFGTVGRLSKGKGHTTLLRAYAQFSQKYPNSRLVIAGEGPLEAELRSLASCLGIENRVLFLGHRTDIPEVLRAYDVFVFPSISEGFGLALVEAMASRIPVIASDVGPIREVLNRPDLGLIVPHSSIDELTTAMERIYLMDKKARGEMGRALRERVLEAFTKERMVSAMTREYLAVAHETY